MNRVVGQEKEERVLFFSLNKSHGLIGERIGQIAFLLDDLVTTKNRIVQVVSGLVAK